MDSKSFFDSLDDGEEYMILMIHKRIYRYIPDDIRECIYISYVSQKNDKLRSDPILKELRAKEKKAKKERQDYEFKINNK